MCDIIYYIIEQKDGCDFPMLRCPLVHKEGDAHEHNGSVNFIISNFCGTVIFRQSL